VDLISYFLKNYKCFGEEMFDWFGSIKLHYSLCKIIEPVCNGGAYAMNVCQELLALLPE
jgi:hypothetical protein